MTEAIAVQSSPETPPVQQGGKLFAVNPAELSEAQGKMCAWVKMKLSELQNDLVELESNRDIAEKNFWAVPPWKRQIAKVVRRIEYYQKMLALLDAGYVMVPSMQMDLFAVRTSKDFPKQATTSYHSTAENRPEEVSPEPLGDGRYVSADATTKMGRDTYTGSDGKQRTDTHYWADEFKDVAFPMDVARPVIMEKTAAAMAMKAFDEIGVVRNANQRRGDPFVVGRIRDPRQNKPGACFFIGWHIDVNDL